MNNIKIKYGTLYEGIHLNNKTLYQSAFFMLERLLLAFALVMLTNIPGILLSFILMVNVASMSYYLGVKPFINKRRNYLEFFNEANLYLIVLLF
jgi:hypothetical protein